jgi:hypothetical protein
MRYCLLALLSCPLLQAQDVKIADEDLVTQQPAPNTPVDDYVPLTLWQNYAWSLHQIFAPGQILATSAGAAIDHSTNDPVKWGGGADGYALRFASRIGRVAVREEIAFAVRAFDHEDPRYFPSPDAGIWRRARYAVVRTFVVRNERGGTMPAYSLLLADFATPFIAQTWRPEPVNVGREVRGGAIGIGVAAIGNLGKEFWPDIRRRLRPQR